MWFRRDILMKDAKKLVLRYEAKNKIDTTTFCTPQYAYPGSVKVKKGRKKKKWDDGIIDGCSLIFFDYRIE